MCNGFSGTDRIIECVICGVLDGGWGSIIPHLSIHEPYNRALFTGIGLYTNILVILIVNIIIA